MDPLQIRELVRAAAGVVGLLSVYCGYKLFCEIPLAKNRTMFALAICRIEFSLALHAAGVGTVDVSGLVEAFDHLRQQAVSMSALPVAA